MSTAFETEGMTWQELVEWAEANGTYLVGVYTLTAEIDGQRSVHTIKCCDDTQAQWEGMEYIARTGALEQGSLRKFWSKGHIVLTDPDGTIVSEMEAKP